MPDVLVIINEFLKYMHIQFIYVYKLFMLFIKFVVGRMVGNFSASARG